MRFRSRPRDRSGADAFHSALLEYICKVEIRRLVDILMGGRADDKDIKSVFKEPLLTSYGAFPVCERNGMNTLVSPDVAVVHSYKGWHLLFVELKARPFRGDIAYIHDTI